MTDRTDCKGMERLYRERAKADPEHSNKWLGQAERWQELARHESAWRFQRRDNRQMHAGPMAVQQRTNDRPWRQMG